MTCNEYVRNLTSLAETKHKSVGSKLSWQICKASSLDFQGFSVMEGWFDAGKPKTITKPKQFNYIKHCTNSVLKSSSFCKTRFEFLTFQHLKRNKEKIGSEEKEMNTRRTTVPFCVIHFTFDTMDQTDTHQNLCTCQSSNEL